jgi:hypothetical protein
MPAPPEAEPPLVGVAVPGADPPAGDAPAPRSSEPAEAVPADAPVAGVVDDGTDVPGPPNASAGSASAPGWAEAAEPLPDGASSAMGISPPAVAGAGAGDGVMNAKYRPMAATATTTTNAARRAPFDTWESFLGDPCER